MKIFYSNNILRILRSLIIAILAFVMVCFPFQPAQAEESLKLIVENETYGKNLEYTGDVDKLTDDNSTEGKTLIGNIFKSYLRYVPTSHVTIETGILFGVPFGSDDRVTPEEPIISFHLDYDPGLRLTAGTIDRRHPLLDAFFDDDLAYTDPIEQGFQYKENNKYLNQDLWLSWEEKETSTRREKISVGNFTRLSFHGLMLEGQLYWVHHGGQRNSGGGIANNMSMGAGVGYSFSPKKRRKAGIIDNIGVTLHYLHNTDDSAVTSEVDGSGTLGKVFVNFMGTNVYYQQWRSTNSDFKPEKGDPLYQAKHYKEFGVEKNFIIGEGIYLTTALKGQWVNGTFVHIDHVSVSWSGEFSLFGDYFKNLGKD